MSQRAASLRGPPDERTEVDRPIFLSPEKHFYCWNQRTKGLSKLSVRAKEYAIRAILATIARAGVHARPSDARATVIGRGRQAPSMAPWQCLNFFPEPHGHGSLRPT